MESSIADDMAKWFADKGQKLKYYREPETKRIFYYVHVPNEVNALFLANGFQLCVNQVFPPIEGFTLMKYTTNYEISHLQFCKRIHKFYIGHMNIPIQHVNSKRWNNKH